MDPDDTRVLDDVVRFIGQKVAAVVADTEAAAEEGCRRLKVEYEILPAVIDPARGDRAGRTRASRRQDGRTARHQRRRATSSPRRMANSAMSPQRWREAAVTYEGTFTTQRVQHAALETHGGLAWVDAAGVLNVRSSTQVPFLTRRALSDIFDLAAGQGAGVLRTRRRRLRRQAGDVRRGHSGAGRAQDRAAGEVRTDARGAVHRDLDAASDARHGQEPAPTRTAS